MRPVETTELTITFDGKRCIHARRCVLGLPEVFKPGERGGWIFPDSASAAQITKVIEACPSGALGYTVKTSGETETAPQVNTARLWENGPLELNGPITVNGVDAGQHALICRCGASANKPFCDGKHASAEFTATSEAPSKDEIPMLAPRNGPLSVETRKDGPVVVSGPLEIITGSGRTIAAAEKNFLCRCGHSKNKPFCDGSHKAAGFEAD